MASRTNKVIDALLLQALACGATVESAARKAGVCERTVYRRLADPAFVAQLQQARGEIVGRTTSMMTAAALESVKTLVELLQSSNPPAVRLGAARSIVELGMKLREATEMAERIAAVEDRLEATG